MANLMRNMADMDGQKRRAIMFGILQNPDMREMLGLSDEED